MGKEKRAFENPILQREGEVRHLVARQLVDHSELLQGLATSSRNFR